MPSECLVFKLGAFCIFLNGEACEASKGLKQLPGWKPLLREDWRVMVGTWPKEGPFWCLYLTCDISSIYLCHLASQTALESIILFWGFLNHFIFLICTLHIYKLALLRNRLSDSAGTQEQRSKAERILIGLGNLWEAKVSLRDAWFSLWDALASLWEGQSLWDRPNLLERGPTTLWEAQFLWERPYISVRGLCVRVNT